MTEKWLQAHIYFTNEQFNDINKSDIRSVLKEVVKHCADFLNSKDMRKTYHYLIEGRTDEKPGVELLLRVEAKEGVDLDDIKEKVEGRIKEYEALTDGWKIDKDFDSPGHIRDFGQDGWELTKQLFEIGSEIAIGGQSKSFIKSGEFNRGKLIHCFLNQHLKSTVDEAEFHADCFVERLVVFRRYVLKDENSEFSIIEKHVDQILEKYLEKWNEYWEKEVKSK